MREKLSNVGSKYGSPMGRRTFVSEAHHTTAKTVACYRILINKSGYDEGGAYWGYVPGRHIYFLKDRRGLTHYEDFVRAGTRFEAWCKTNLPMSSLIVPACDDKRYTVTLEHVGLTEPQYIARFCGDYIGAGERIDYAWALCRSAYLSRMGAHS